jgi:hypothetical protein
LRSPSRAYSISCRIESRHVFKAGCANVVATLQDVLSSVPQAIQSYFRFFSEVPPPIPQVSDLTAYAIRNKEVISNALDLTSFVLVTPEIARRLIPSKNMISQNYTILFIIYLTIFTAYRSIGGMFLVIIGTLLFLHLYPWASLNGLIQNWRHDSGVLSSLLIGEKVSKALLPFGIALFLLSRIFEFYIAIEAA